MSGAWGLVFGVRYLALGVRCNIGDGALPPAAARPPPPARPLQGRQWSCGERRDLSVRRAEVWRHLRNFGEGWRNQVYVLGLTSLPVARCADIAHALPLSPSALSSVLYLSVLFLFPISSPSLPHLYLCPISISPPFLSPMISSGNPAPKKGQVGPDTGSPENQPATIPLDHSTPCYHDA